MKFTERYNSYNPTPTRFKADNLLISQSSFNFKSVKS